LNGSYIVGVTPLTEEPINLDEKEDEKQDVPAESDTEGSEIEGEE